MNAASIHPKIIETTVATAAVKTTSSLSKHDDDDDDFVGSNDDLTVMIDTDDTFNSVYNILSKEKVREMCYYGR
jgi:hypothetical protein